MIRFRFRGLTIIIHPLTLLPVFASLICGKSTLLIAAVLALLFHETGHLLCAYCLHVKVSDIEFSLFGGIMHCEMQHLRRSQQIILSLSGPLFSLIGYVICYLLLFHPSSLTILYLECLRANLLLFLINLLPVLPLDGGHILIALFYNHKVCRRILSYAGIIVGLFFIFVSFFAAINGYLLLFPALSGCFLMHYASKTSENHAALCMHRTISCFDQLHKGRVIPIHHIAAAGNLELCKVPSVLPQGITYIHVLDEYTHRELGTISPTQLCELMIEDPSLLLCNTVERTSNIAIQSKL